VTRSLRQLVAQPIRPKFSANRHLNDVSHGIGGRQMTLRFEPIRVLNADPILIVQIRTGLDRSVGFNERVTAFTTDTACMPSSNIKGRICPIYTSDIENRQHRSLLEHRRRQITDVHVVKKFASQTKPQAAAAGRCGDHKTTAASDHPWSPIY